MSWWNLVVRRAGADTLAGLGISNFSLLRLALWGAVSIAFVGLIWLARGGGEAMTEASEIAFYALAFVGAAVLPLFLWNLWLAPYRILKEEIEKIPKTRGPTVCANLAPGGFHVEDWEGIRIFQLGDASCLWVGEIPHKPITNVRALAVFKRLSGAMMAGRIPYNRNSLAAILSGQGKWPSHSTTVAAISLRKYADEIGDVPKFLQSVVVPVEQELPEQKEAG